MIGRNNSFFDGIYAILFNRDNELIDIVAKLAVYLVINMATAMFVMFWIFIAGLPRFIWTFGASWVRHCTACTACTASTASWVRRRLHRVTAAHA